MDEFAIQKGHRYATVVVEAATKRVLWVGRGRGREDVRPFFQSLGPEGRARLKAVAMDMHAAFEEEVRMHCPQAEIVYDLFHVVAKYGREVVDRVRVDEANRLRNDKKARKVVKGARWLLLRNSANIRRQKDRVRLQELLAANRALATTYVLKDDLKHLGTTPTKGRPGGSGRSGTTGPFAAESNRSSSSPAIFANVSRGFSPIAVSPCTPRYWRASTTRSRSSRGWPTVTGTTSISSSRSAPRFPEMGHEPFFTQLSPAKEARASR